MSIFGLIRNQWNIPLSKSGNSKNSKYIIEVRLDGQLSISTAVDLYSDVLF